MTEPEDIRKLNARIDEFKQQHLDPDKKPQVKSAATAHTVTGFQISAELIAGVLVGAGIGYLIDDIFNTRPWGLTVFLIFGGLAGILNIYKTFKSNDGKEGVM